MGSFRNRLLVLIIGLVVVTQTVTLIAVLMRTARDVEARGAEQLRSGGTVVQQFIRFRTTELAGGVAVLAADFGFREAVASGDKATMLSAAQNHSMRIGADLVLLMDPAGHVLVSTQDPGRGVALDGLIAGASSAREQAHFMVFGGHPYQLVLAPVRAPEIIAWVAMGFAVDEELAQRIRDLVGVQVSIIANGLDGAGEVS